MDHGPYSVTQITSFLGTECPGFSAVLCRDGRPIAAVSDPGDGSNVRLTCFHDGERERLAGFLSGLPPEPFPQLPEGIAIDADFFVCALVDTHLSLAQCAATLEPQHREAA